MEKGYDFPEVYELLKEWLYNSYQVNKRKKR
jgi:hypothetical protein